MYYDYNMPGIIVINELHYDYLTVLWIHITKRCLLSTESTIYYFFQCNKAFCTGMQKL